MEYINEKLNKFNNSLEGKKVAIIGMGVSNSPLLDYFGDKNAKLTILDSKALSDEIMEKINKYGYSIDTNPDNMTRLKDYDIIFRSPSIMPNTIEMEKAKESGTIVTSEIEMVLKLAPCTIIGVTGTEGKTTTTSIIYEIMKKSGRKCFLGGNIGKPIFTEIKNMKPEDVVILELSSFQLMGMDISPDISVVTNIYPDHLNIHKSYEEYQEAKKNIFKYQNQEGIVVLNKDNSITNSFKKEANGKVILFSSNEKLNQGYYYDREKEEIKFGEKSLIKRKEIKLRGIHNYENICAALAATSSIVDEEVQIEAIKSFSGVEHRLEFVRELDGVKYYNDSIGTSPASTIAGLNSFEENIVLLAGGSDKGLDYKEVGKAIANHVGTLILTGPTSEKIEKATLEAAQNLNKSINIYYAKNMEEAVKMAKEKAVSGDIVLLSPASASFDLYKNFEERGKIFKDIVNNL